MNIIAQLRVIPKAHAQVTLTRAEALTLAAALAAAYAEIDAYRKHLEGTNFMPELRKATDEARARLNG